MSKPTDTAAAVIVCPKCKTHLGVSTGRRVCVGGTTAVAHRVTLTCMRCGTKRQWRPASPPPR